jgi:hypothetical protein
MAACLYPPLGDSAMPKIFQALSNIALVMNSEHHIAAVLDYETQRFDSLIKLAPAGDGFDAGSEMLFTRSTEHELVFTTSFHHTDNEDIWTEHSVIVRSDLTCGFTLEVTGKDHNGIKEHIANAFTQYLMMDEPK